jgi:hypothetical protein
VLKQLDRNEARIARLFMDRRGDRGSVADPVDRIVAVVRE